MNQARPTPPHLTSVQAEQLLARACENEAENAKRMRMGMEPVSQPMPITVDQLLRYENRQHGSTVGLNGS